MKKILFALCLLFSTLTNAQEIAQAEYVFYRNPSVAVVGPVSGSWQNIGTAASASAIWLSGMPKIKRATWRVIWNPQSVAGLVGIRLVRLDYPPGGGITVTELARVQSSVYAGGVNSPVAYTQDVTAAIQTINDTNALFQQGHGNGANGWKLYTSSVDIVYEM
jgi:hypothetical protein